MCIRDRAGIYIWSRCLPRVPEVVTNREEFLPWLESALAAPFVRAPGVCIKSSSEGTKGAVTIRPNLVEFEAFRIGGNVELSAAKRELLDTQIQSTKFRQDTYNLLQSCVLEFGPAFYVGEADCLRTRVSDHLGQNSSIRKRLNDAGIEMEESTSLRFMRMDGATKEDRTLLEQILTHLLVLSLIHI